MTLWMPNKKKPLYAPMLATFGGGSVRGFKSGSSFDGIGTISEHYQAGSEDGIQTITFATQTLDMNFVSYDNKGWVEVMFCGDVPYGTQESTNFYNLVNGEYYLKDEGLSGGILDYTNDISKIMLDGEMTPTDIAITSKSYRSEATITATGYNETGALPLIGSSDLYGNHSSACLTRMLSYFTGGSAGFSAFSTLTSQQSNEFNAWWTSGNDPTLKFALVLHSRGNTAQTDHWMIADGQSNTGSTYHPNIGFRGSTSGSSYAGKHVGSWVSSINPRSPSALMDNANVFSVWLTDM